jgi:hypothetical protein
MKDVKRMKRMKGRGGVTGHRRAPMPGPHTSGQPHTIRSPFMSFIRFMPFMSFPLIVTRMRARAWLVAETDR